MAEVTLKKRDTEVLKINIGDKAYSLPLGGSIPYKQLKKLRTEDGIFEFLSAHLPAEVMDVLSTEDIKTIFTAWGEATKKQSGLKLGGIISLKEFIENHREAVEADLITSAGVELNDIGGSLSWGAFGSFVKNLGYDSAVFRSQHPDMAEWGSTLKTNIILADIFDVLCQINANMVGGLSHKRPQRPKPYPRPWVDKKRKTGKGALPVSELEKWIEQKRHEPRRRTDGKH